MNLRLFSAIMIEILLIAVLGQDDVEETTEEPKEELISTTTTSTTLEASPESDITMPDASPGSDPTMPDASPGSDLTMPDTSPGSDLTRPDASLETKDLTTSLSGTVLSNQSIATNGNAGHNSAPKLIPNMFFICTNLMPCKHKNCTCSPYARICYGPYIKVMCPNGIHNINQQNVGINPFDNYK